MLDLAADNFDHTGLNFIGGAAISMGNYLGGNVNTLTLVALGPNNFGSGYKTALKGAKLPTQLHVSAGGTGPIIPTTDWFYDLDPHYIDMFGDPLLRMTMDADNNSINASNYLVDKAAEILTKMGCTNVNTSKVSLSSLPRNDRWSAHQRGGARMGSNPNTSVFNKWMQSWDVENVFSAGEHSITFGDSVTPGTHGIGPLAYIAADGIKKYLQSPGPLA